MLDSLPVSVVLLYKSDKYIFENSFQNVWLIRMETATERLKGISNIQDHFGSVYFAWKPMLRNRWSK